MYKRHKISVWTIFILSFCALTYCRYEINKDAVSNLITFFSIVFGFCFTAFSSLYGSGFSRRLYEEEDPSLNSQTKLHTLKSYFKISSLVFLSSTLLLILISLFGSKDCLEECQNIGKWCVLIKEQEYCFISLLSAAAVSLSVVSILFIYFLLKIFLNAFVEEGSSSHPHHAKSDKNNEGVGHPKAKLRKSRKK